jgi:hypothetical protein
MAGSGTNRIVGVETIVLYIAKMGGLKINFADLKSAKLRIFFQNADLDQKHCFFPYKFADLRTGTLRIFGDLQFAD